MRRNWLRVVQKILAEGFRQLNPARRQQFPHFGKFHSENQPRINTDGHGLKIKIREQSVFICVNPWSKLRRVRLRLSPVAPW